MPTARSRWRCIGGSSPPWPISWTGSAAAIPAYRYFDLSGHYQVNLKIELSAGITNLFDKQEPFVAGAPLLTDAATYDILGRQYYVGIRASLD